MSRLRRPFLYDRYIFVTVNLLRSRGKLDECDFGQLAIALARMREKQRFRLTAWVFLPHHWHAIIYPPHPLSLAQAMSAVKVSSIIAINHGRHEKGERWQERFFDLALRMLRDYGETHIHLNLVRQGLVKRPEQWKWSGFPEYAGVDAANQQSRCGLPLDRVRLPADENARI